MCIGFISDKYGEWLIKGRLYYENKIKDGEILFLIDTGSEKTVLSLTEAKKFGINYNSLPLYNRHIMGGDYRPIEVRCLNNAGIAIFDESKNKYHIEICNRILVADAYWKRNVIGRDILNRFKIDPEISDKVIYLTRKSISPNYITSD